MKQSVEAAQAGKAARECDVADAKSRIGEQTLGEEQALRLREGDGGNAEFGLDHTPQMAFADAQTGRQIRHAAVGKRAIFDSTCGLGGKAAERIHTGISRREFGAAAQTGPVARALGSGGAGVERAPVPARRFSRADRPAVDSCTGNADKKDAVKARVMGPQSLVTSVSIKCHTVL